jgi:RNase H-fold protein (predicted Holliday junction resolvase)
MDNNMNDEGQEPFFAEPIKQHSTKQITELFKQIDSAVRITEENYSDETRSTKVAREIQNSLVSNKELYRERKNTARQLSLLCFI